MLYYLESMCITSNYWFIKVIKKGKILFSESIKACNRITLTMETLRWMPHTTSYFLWNIHLLLVKQLQPFHEIFLYFPHQESNHDNNMLQPSKSLQQNYHNFISLASSECTPYTHSQIIYEYGESRRNNIMHSTYGACGIKLLEHLQLTPQLLCR